MTEMSPAVTFTRGAEVDTQGSSGQLVSNTAMKVARVWWSPAVCRCWT